MQLAVSATARPTKLGSSPSVDKESTLKEIKRKTFTYILGKLIWYWYAGNFAEQRQFQKSVTGLSLNEWRCLE